MRRKEGCFRLYAVQLPELLRRCPGLLAENRDKVADIAVAAEGGDAVERSVGTADEKLLGAADAQNADVRADRAADKTLEQACQILRRDMELFREIIHIERVGKMTSISCIAGRTYWRYSGCSVRERPVRSWERRVRNSKHPTESAASSMSFFRKCESIMRSIHS